MPKLEWFIGDLHIKKLKLYFKDVPLSDITPAMVDDTFRRMAEDGVSQHQRSKLFGLLRRSLRYAQKRGDVASNACDLCDGYSYKGPDPKRKEEKRISTSELQRFLRELDAEMRFSFLKSSWDWSWYDSRALDGFEDAIMGAYAFCRSLPPTFAELITRLFVAQRDYVNKVASGEWA